MYLNRIIATPTLSSTTQILCYCWITCGPWPIACSYVLTFWHTLFRSLDVSACLIGSFLGFEHSLGRWFTSSQYVPPFWLMPICIDGTLSSEPDSLHLATVSLFITRQIYPNTCLPRFFARRVSVSKCVLKTESNPIFNPEPVSFRYAVAAGVAVGVTNMRNGPKTQTLFTRSGLSSSGETG